MNEMLKPDFKHDGCPDCVFRGHIGGEDIYTCRDTVMRRYGNEPEEYQSMFSGSLSTAAALDETWDAVQLFLGYPPAAALAAPPVGGTE